MLNKDLHGIYNGNGFNNNPHDCKVRVVVVDVVSLALALNLNFIFFLFIIYTQQLRIFLIFCTTFKSLNLHVFIVLY
jgi:hypothetical protein